MPLPPLAALTAAPGQDVWRRATLQGGDVAALALQPSLDYWHSPRYEEPSHALDGQAVAQKVLHHRDTLPQAEVMKLEHTRHRSPINALGHIFSCLAAYTLV